MTFTPKTWQNSPSTATPTDAAAFIDLETRLAAYTDSKSLPNIKDFGATGNGSTDDAGAIQAAIDSVAASGGGLIRFGVGTFLVNSPIVLKDKTGIIGSGRRATTIKAGVNINGPVIKNYVSPDNIVANAETVYIADLMIDGNKANQATNPTTCHGIQFDSSPTATTATNDFNYDTLQYVQSVMIWNVAGNGVNTTSRQSTYLDGVYSYFADGNGFFIGQDTTLSGCVSGQSGLEGFLFKNSSSAAIGCKAFYSGRITAGSGRGFRVNISGGGSGLTLTGCIAQDNKDAGFLIDTSSRVIMSGCVADSNSTRSAGGLPGVDLFAATNCVIDCICSERKADGSNSFQTRSLRLRSSSINNAIKITHSAIAGATVNANPFTADTVNFQGNTFVINNTNGQQAIAFSATPTIDVLSGGTVSFGTLTGNVTSMTITNAWAGARLRFIFTQDATGTRTVAWPGTFKVSATAVSATALKVSTVDFEYDGTNWNQVGGIAGL